MRHGVDEKEWYNVELIASGIERGSEIGKALLGSMAETLSPIQRREF